VGFNQRASSTKELLY